MTTRATMHYLGVYQDIIENYEDDEMFNRLAQLDEIAETCLTTSEFFNYTKNTRKYFEKLINIGK